MTDIQANIDGPKLGGNGSNGDIGVSFLESAQQIESLNSIMRQKLSLRFEDGTSRTEVLNRVNTELSVSLPNLSDESSVIFEQNGSSNEQLRVRSSLSNIFDHYNSTVKKGSPSLSNALSLDGKNMDTSSGQKKSSASLDAADKSPNSKRLDVSVKKAIASTDDAPIHEPSTETVPARSESPTSMQSQNLDISDCNGSLNSTLTEASHFEVAHPEDTSTDQLMPEQSQSTSQESQHQTLSQKDGEEDSFCESTESTKLQASAPTNIVNDPPAAKGHSKVGSAGDASDFSSISSLSTSTDASAATSSETEMTETPATTTQSPLQDEQGFVEISLNSSNSRNSFERARGSGSSQDSGIVDLKHQQQQQHLPETLGPKSTIPSISAITGGGAGAKPKRKGFTSFLTR